MEEGVEAYRAALEEYTRARASMDWARTQSNLGNALRSVGRLTGDAACMEDAVEAYRAALEEYTRARAPMDWARTQNHRLRSPSG
jgi:predicted LPLAT superfamily acyltransferase